MENMNNRILNKEELITTLTHPDKSQYVVIDNDNNIILVPAEINKITSILNGLARPADYGWKYIIQAGLTKENAINTTNNIESSELPF